MSDSHCFNINQPVIMLIIFNFYVFLFLCAGGGGGSCATGCVVLIIIHACRIMLRLKCVIDFDHPGALQATLEQGPFPD